MAIRCQIASVDFTGDISIEVGFDAKPDTQGVQHWKTLNQSDVEDITWLWSQTLHSGIQLGMAAKLVLDDGNASGRSFQLQAGETVTLEKNCYSIHLTGYRKPDCRCKTMLK